MSSDELVERLPQTAPGHWDTAEGREMAESYVVQERGDLMMGELSDLALANAQFLASRHDLDLISYQTAAKERIRWLSARYAQAADRIADLERRIAVKDAALDTAEQAMAQVVEGDGGFIVVKRYRNDGVPSKSDMCAHEQFAHQGCATCADAVLDVALEAVRRACAAIADGGDK